MTRILWDRQLDSLGALVQLQSQLEQVFPFGWLGAAPRAERSFPPVNLFRTEDGYSLRLEVPGVAPEAISVEAERGALRVTGRRSAAAVPGAPRRTERWSGEFSRTLRLPADADVQRASAAYRRGLLSIAVPLREEARARRIQIEQ